MKLYIPPHLLLSYWWRTRREYAQAQHELPERWREFHGQWPDANPHGIFFTACDAEYFRLYGENYIASVARSGGGQSVHLHLYDGNEAQANRARVFGRRHGVAVSVTRDRFADAALYSVYLYAAGRFVLLPRVVRESGSPVICTDIDVLIRGSFDAAIAALAGNDASLHLRPKSSLPWRKVLASTVIGLPGDAGQHFFGTVASVLADILSRPVAHHVDQMILYLAYRQARAATARPVRFAPMAKQLIDWDFDECSLMWNAKGPERKPAYWEAAQQLTTPAAISPAPAPAPAPDAVPPPRARSA